MEQRKIEIFLYDGDPDCIRTAQMNHSTVFAISFRRIQTKEVLNRFKDEVRKHGIYILIGRNGSQQQAYIGESENVGGRLSFYYAGKKKEFWDETVVLLCNNSTLTKSDIRYGESKLCSVVSGNTQWELLNKGKPSPNAGNLRDEDRVVMDQFIDRAKVLVKTLGWDILRDMRYNQPPNRNDKALASKVHSIENDNFAIKGKGYEAKMRADTSGNCFILKGSKARMNTTKSADENLKLERKSLEDGGVLKKRDGYLVFTCDYRFNSPSSAGSIVAGHRVNGRSSWKLDDDSTYGDWEKKQTTESEGPLFLLKGKTYDAKSLIDTTGSCIVRKGSKARIDTSDSASENLESHRKVLLAEKVIEQEDNFLVFSSDCRFDSPSAAGSIVVGHGVNGLERWKLEDGTTYGDWKKKQTTNSKEETN